jgi:hypothetical protein
MLIIQHIWTQWTKQSRGANARRVRPRLAEAYRLPEMPTAGPVVRHEIRVLEAEDFAFIEQAGPTDRDAWPRLQPHRNNALDWREKRGLFEIILAKPSEYRQQTKWPARLADPLFTLAEGETARIEWNGRFRTSMGGTNRSSYYEQHVYWLGVAALPSPRMFLDAQPKKRIDLRTGIY